jgi:hypothetical protein
MLLKGNVRPEWLCLQTIMKIGHNLQLSDGEHFLSFEVKEVTAAMVKERNIDGRQ